MITEQVSPGDQCEHSKYNDTKCMSVVYFAVVRYCRTNVQVNNATFYLLEVSTTANTGTSVLTARASDPDTGDFGQVCEILQYRNSVNLSPGEKFRQSIQVTKI